MFVRDAVRFNNTLAVMSTVGIGTTASPNTMLNVTTPSGRTSNMVTLTNQGTGHSLRINTTGSNIIIDNMGKIGVNTNTPQFTLDVQGDINFGGALYQSGFRYISSQWLGSSGTSIFYDGNVGIGTTLPRFGLHVHNLDASIGCNLFVGSNVSVNGTVYAQGSFVTTSDRTVKTDLLPILHPLEKIEKINGYTYYRTDTHKRETGLVAQEVLQVLPEVINQESQLMSISYGNMAGLFVEAFKELQQRVSVLEAEVKRLGQKS
jgi:hypothetical protein